jgi:hypothetical protein
MNIKNEFATIDVILSSEAETRGVDAFALALIKAERQMRKLFTYIVFQSSAFDCNHVAGLRSALAERRLYFRDFVSAWDKLYIKSLEEIVCTDFDRLFAAVVKAIEYRNKIFHGQLTTEYLSREDLISCVGQIREWCQVVADRAQLEIGYDGFGRNSFRKSNVAFENRLGVKLTSISDYSQFLMQLEKNRQRGEPLAPTATTTNGLSNNRRRTGRIRDLKQIPFGEDLVKKFSEWLGYFEAHGPFSKKGQLECHVDTIARRRELGSAEAAVVDEQFLRALYKTLRAWGIGVRRSRLKPFEEFAASFGRQKQAVAEFEGLAIDDPGLNVSGTTDALWTLLSQLQIVENAATLVPLTKALHHVLPELVVPMDREYTQMFFGWQNHQFQYGQRDCFTEGFSIFTQIARSVNPSQYVSKGWNSSPTKVIDNGLVGLMRHVRDQV